MSKEKRSLWVEKFRPSSLTDKSYIYNDDSLRRFALSTLKSGELPHLLFYGPAGTGKTTISNALIEDLGIDQCDVLKINASDENSIDDMREKVKTFVSTWSLGKYKVILLDEAERISPQGQDILKNIMEQYYDNARFILTTNKINNISEPLKSRCQSFEIKKHNAETILSLVVGILKKESITYDDNLVKKYVAAYYPDIRKTINTLQQNVSGGKLFAPKSSDSDPKLKIITLLEEGSLTELRTFACANIHDSEWEDVYRLLYDNIHKTETFKDQDKWEQAMIAIAEHLYKNKLVTDPEINFAACAIKLDRIGRGGSNGQKKKS